VETAVPNPAFKNQNITADKMVAIACLLSQDHWNIMVNTTEASEAQHPFRKMRQYLFQENKSNAPTQ
jgi:hypothetical protein